MNLRAYLLVVMFLAGALAGCGSSDDDVAASPTVTPTGAVLCGGLGDTTSGCAGPTPTPTLGPCTAAALMSCSVCSTIGGCCTLTTPNGCFDPSVAPFQPNGIGNTLCYQDQGAACLIGSMPTPPAATPTSPAATPTPPAATPTPPAAASTPTAMTTCPSMATATSPPAPPAAAVTPGMVMFVNNCTVDLNMYSSGPTAVSLPETLTANGSQASVQISGLQANGSYIVVAYPNLTATQCPNCDEWTVLGPAPPAPQAVQREGWMWMGDNMPYAAYCNPSLSGRSICAAQQNCCGPNMVQDGSFGTRWEFSPDAFGGNDYVNLSTNFGTGPCDPPPLCGNPGVDPDNCVTINANIFFNVPINWTTNSACSFTTQGTSVMGLQCLTVDCPDAYQYPTDDKQCACSSGSGRGYVVEYCPPGSSMPAPPG